MLNERPASLMRNLGSVSSGSAHRSCCIPESPRMYLAPAAELARVRVTQAVLVLKACRGHGEQLRSGTVWQGRGPREQQGLRGHCEELEDKA